MEGWIKLHRNMLEWEWYDDVPTKVVFLHCLLKANYSEKDWRGTLIKRGEFVTSVQKLANETGFSVKKIRTILGKLKGKELAINSTTQYTVIQVVRYEEYQSGANEGQTKGQTKGKRRATTKEVKNNKNNKEMDFSAVPKDKIELAKKWVQYRKEIRKKFTQTSLDNLAKQLSLHTRESCDRVINNSISNGWQGLFWDNAEKENNDNNQFTLDRNKL